MQEIRGGFYILLGGPAKRTFLKTHFLQPLPHQMLTFLENELKTSTLTSHVIVRARTGRSEPESKGDEKAPQERPEFLPKRH